MLNFSINSSNNSCSLKSLLVYSQVWNSQSPSAGYTWRRSGRFRKWSGEGRPITLPKVKHQSMKRCFYFRNEEVLLLTSKISTGPNKIMTTISVNDFIKLFPKFFTVLHTIYQFSEYNGVRKFMNLVKYYLGSICIEWILVYKGSDRRAFMYEIERSCGTI